MENKTIEQVFAEMKPLFRSGDGPRIAEMSGKKKSICNKIIAGSRTPQMWFIVSAEKYLKTLGRID